MGNDSVQYEILPPHLAIKSMRDSGYRDTAHALAELVDNSVQAGLHVNEKTEIEIICVDNVEHFNGRQRQRMSEIAVYDNACGMSADTLRMALQFGNGTHLEKNAQSGIGKFGMGLPNASISQCQRVDVWSWQNDKYYHTYIDIQEILRGGLRSVPEPQMSLVPNKWKKLLRNEIESHGTLVVWSNLDRVRWKTSSAFFRNAEYLIGRMYRKFLTHDQVRIRLAAYEDAGGAVSYKSDDDVLPNDPLYLQKYTSCPHPFDGKPAFDLVDEFPVKVGINGIEHEVILRFSVASKEARKLGGSSALGKHAAKNQGVSLVRAGRELELNSTFDVRYDPRERWWGVEVEFTPDLDTIFGVTNTKQSATAFKECDLDEDAKAEGCTPGEYREMLLEDGDSRYAIYEISREIKSNLSRIREQIKRMREGVKTEEELVAPPGSAEDIASRATAKRRELIGDKGKSDIDEKMPVEEKRDVLKGELVATGGLKEQEAKEIAIEYAGRQDIKYLFQEASISGPQIFDIRSKGGKILILLNTRHPASANLFELLKNDSTDHPALAGLKILLMAWARLEDEASDKYREALEDIRTDWGRMARDFMAEVDE